jgi:hypothetical protein
VETVVRCGEGLQSIREATLAPGVQRTIGEGGLPPRSSAYGGRSVGEQWLGESLDSRPPFAAGVYGSGQVSLCSSPTAVPCLAATNPTNVQEESAMTVCKNIKTFSRSHERIADFFSLLAIALLFTSVWATLEYHLLVLEWLQADSLVHGALLVIALGAIAFLILGFLAVGSARFGEDNERCFGTFRRRSNSGSPLDFFRAWVNHIESVGKKHR